MACDDQAYLELSEPAMIELSTTTLAKVASVDVEIHNTGFGAMNVAVSFLGDDCTPDSVSAPNFNWLEVPAVSEPMPAGSSATIALAGDFVGCQPGEFEGELVFSSLEGNALDARLPVKLRVLEPVPAMRWFGLLLLAASVLAVGVRRLLPHRSTDLQYRLHRRGCAPAYMSLAHRGWLRNQSGHQHCMLFAKQMFHQHQRCSLRGCHYR